jgi:hypothetical protein
LQAQLKSKQREINKRNEKEKKRMGKREHYQLFYINQKMSNNPIYLYFYK